MKGGAGGRAAGGEPLVLRAELRDGRLVLLPPTVGVFTCARRRGEVLTPGQPAGVLRVLGRSHTLLVPEDAAAAGRIANRRPEAVHAPVGWDTVLYELEPVESAGLAAVEEADAADEGGLVVRSFQSGRFWHRASPGDPPFAAAGTELVEGHPVGLIEVMKTFTLVPYQATGGLPARARVVRLLVDDGAEVDRGQALVEVEAL